MTKPRCSLSANEPRGPSKDLPARLARTATAIATIVASLLRLCLVDRQAAAFELLLVQRIARGPSLVIVVHLDEPKSARTSGIVIANQTD